MYICFERDIKLIEKEVLECFLIQEAHAQGESLKIIKRILFGLERSILFDDIRAKQLRERPFKEKDIHAFKTYLNCEDPGGESINH
jgi:hypothetical protein